MFSYIHFLAGVFAAIVGLAPTAVEPTAQAYATASGQGREGISKHRLRFHSRGGVFAVLRRLGGLSRYLTGVARSFRLGPLAGLRTAFHPDLARLMAAPAAGGEVVGQRSTGNVAERIYETDMRAGIIELDPSATPYLVLSKRASMGGGGEDMVAINPEFSWWEDQLDARFDTAAAEAAKEATTVEVNASATWAADDLLYVSRTGEILRVTKNEEGTLTVVRGVGSTEAKIEEGDELLKIGSAAMEGAEDKAAESKNPSEIKNYTQIFRRPVDMTGTARATRNRTSPRDWDRAMNHAGMEHALDIERQFMFGTPSKDTTGTNPRRTTGGFNYFATQNITDVGGQMTEQEFFTALTPIFRFGSGGASGATKVKMAACSANAVDIMTAFPRSKIQTETPDRDQTYGINMIQILTPHGVLNLVTHYLLEGEKHGNEVWVTDPTNLGYKYLHGDQENRDTHIRHDIQAPGTDGKKDEYLTECGMVLAQPKTHGKIINITS